MLVRGWRPLRGALAFALVGLFVAFQGAPDALAQAKAKTERANGKVVAYDAEARTLTIKDKGRETTFNVKPEGSVLTRTTVTLNSKPSSVDELKPDRVVVVYWRANATDPEQKDARKIDIPNIPEGLEDE